MGRGEGSDVGLGDGRGVGVLVGTGKGSDVGSGEGRGVGEVVYEVLKVDIETLLPTTKVVRRVHAHVTFVVV